MNTIYIEGKPYEVKEGQNLLTACLSLGFDIPYFCWHPAINSVGACRLCAVKMFKDENDAKGKIVMSCMTPAAQDTRISIEDPQAKKFRKSVLEWLMTNHPHDCPVCDEGGECHLQDMTEMTGQVYRRYRFKKRTYRNQDLGPYVTHEMNRCIQCYRCVRFYRDYAGGKDLAVLGWHNHVYFGRHQDGKLESEFSGNLAEVCPTGVFDDKTFARHFTRKWDLQTAPSICTHCGLGCNIIAAERYGTLRRIRNRYHHEINGYFICDRGRFGYEFVNSDQRLTKPLRRDNSKLVPITKENAVSDISALIKQGDMIGIGSPNASVEANFALRTLVGAGNFYCGIPDHQADAIKSMISILSEGTTPAASLEDVRKSDAVLILGEDIPEAAPMLGLALRQSILNAPKAAILKKLKIDEWNDAAMRQAIQDQRGPLFICSANSTHLDEIATATYHGGADNIAKLGSAVAHELDASQPAVEITADVSELAKQISAALASAQQPLVIVGTNSGEQTLRSAGIVAEILRAQNKNARICFVVPHCNSFGLAILDAGHITEAIATIESGKAQTVIILENDLNHNIGNELSERLIRSAKNLIVLNSLPNITQANAAYVLPAATFAECTGTFVNNETRAQRFFKVFEPKPDIQESWRWLRDLAINAGISELAQWHIIDDVIADLCAAVPIFKPIAQIAQPASFRIAGQKIARQHTRSSGRTAMTANIDVNEPAPPQDPDSPLAFSMEGCQCQPPSPLIPRFWAPGWNSVQSVTKFQSEVGGELRGGDPGRRLIEPANKK